MGGSAWVTLATNDSYSLGALVLAHSLKQTGTVHQLAVLVTPGVTSAMREKLASVFNLVQEVNILDSRDEANLRLLKRPELGITFTKLHCWRLTQFDKCVFLDADTLVLKNSDELFEREELSAAPDVGWPDCFNSGVFVYRPSLETYDKLIKFALEKGSFDGGDQGLLNLFFSDWAHKDISKHLPFIYNLCSTACYSYLPAFKQFGANAKIIHFIGAQKPWLQYFNTETKKVQPSGESSHLQEILQLWWDIFCSLIHPHLSPAMAGLAGAFSQLTLGVARTADQDALENVLRKQAWEVGNIDYLGKDSFENIWSKISKTLSAAPLQPEEPVAAEPELPTASAEPEIAPAESQSQTALQDVATPDLPPVPPIDPKVDSTESSPVQEPLISPSQPESVLPQPPLETVPVEVISEPAQESPVESATEIKQPEAPVLVEKEAEVKETAADVPVVAGNIEETVIEPLPAVEVELPVSAPAAPEPAAVVEASPAAPVSPIEPSIPEPKPAITEAIVAPKSDTPASPADPVTEIVEAPKPDSAVTPAAAETEAIVAPQPEASETPAVAEAPRPEPDRVSATAATDSPAVVAPSVLEATPVAAVTDPKKPAVPESPTAAEATAKPLECSLKTKVVEATPPATPGTPPATPPVEKTKQALTAEAAVPETPPPSEGASTPTPPPRKTDKPKKVAAKPKK